MPASSATRSNSASSLSSSSRMRKRGPLDQAVASRSWWAAQAVVGERLTADWATRAVLDDHEDEDRSEGARRRSGENRKPRCRRRGSEGKVAHLPGPPRWAGAAHVLLNGSLADTDGELEELAADAFDRPRTGSPAPSAGSG